MSERLATLARRLMEKRVRRDDTKSEAARAERDYRQEEAAFWDRLDDEGLPSLDLELGEPYGRVQFQRRATVRARVLDKTRLAQALIDAGRGQELIDEVALRGAPLNEYVRDLLRSEAEFPEGLDFTTTRSVHISRKADD
jgi:hypothetical protein